jgi:hypothetical protein
LPIGVDFQVLSSLRLGWLLFLTAGAKGVQKSKPLGQGFRSSISFTNQIQTPELVQNIELAETGRTAQTVFAQA